MMTPMRCRQAIWATAIGILLSAAGVGPVTAANPLGLAMPSGAGGSASMNGAPIERVAATAVSARSLTAACAANGGCFHKAGATWQQIKSDGSMLGTYTEVSLDDQAVVLRDDTRDLNIRINVAAGLVEYAQGNAPFAKLFNIVATQPSNATASADPAPMAPPTTAPQPPVPPAVPPAPAPAPKAGGGTLPTGTAEVTAKPAPKTAAGGTTLPDGTVEMTAKPQPGVPAGYELVTASPLSQGDMTKVMGWIAAHAGAKRLPFCWKQSSPRGAGEPLSGSCRPGLEKSGALCYEKCKAGYTGGASTCVQSCPAGFSDIGLFCQKPQPYTRGAGYALWSADKCSRENAQGCEKNGAMLYPKCKAGFHAVGCCICSPDCPAGFADSGTGCTKPSYMRSAGETLACRSGLERSGFLCYPGCQAGYAGNGPVCWQACPAQHSTDCGGGCATTKAQCGITMGNQIISPIMAVISIATLGEAGAAANAAKGGAIAAQEGAKVAQATSQAARAGAEIKAAYQALKLGLTQTKGGLAAAMGPNGAAKLAELQTRIQIAGGTYRLATALTKQIDLFQSRYADSFALQTTDAIDEQIDNAFGRKAAREIKKEWALQSLNLMLGADGFASAKNFITVLSVIDITGIESVYNAFLHPICGNDTQFPKVAALYKE